MNHSRKKYMSYHSMAHKIVTNKKEIRMIINDPKQDMARGWICPKCGRVNSPLIGTCPCHLLNNREYKLGTNTAKSSEICKQNHSQQEDICSYCSNGWARVTTAESDSCMSHYCSKRGY